MIKNWEINSKDDIRVNDITRKYGINKILARIMVNRNLDIEQNMEIYLNPNRNSFHDPFLLPDMEIAVNRIIKAIENKEKIMIYGDYDADGITSITVLKSFLLERGANVDAYIPNRLHEGYGLNKKALKTIVESGHSLVITVDCGITAIEEVEYIKTLGVDIIITDHHEPAEELPRALAVVDAKRKDNKYPFNELAGVGIAFKVSQAISNKLKLEDKEFLKFLDIVCVGTISDIVPLVDENRVIAKLGLKLINATKNLGLKTMIDKMGYEYIDSYAVSFGIAPRINACGRLGNHQVALDLLLEKDELKAVELTETLEKYNIERKTIESKIYDDVLNGVCSNDKKIIIMGSDKWHHGVIGIVSSKITENFFKPSILLCFEEEVAKGSGRSIKGFDLHNALTNSQDNIARFGGHSMAVGLSVNKENFEAFKKDVEEYVQNTDIDKIVPVINIDDDIALKDLKFDDVRSFSILEPFGEANRKPIFSFSNLSINSIRTLSEGKHLKMTLKDEKNVIDAIGFNIGNLIEEYSMNDKVDIAGNLDINSYNGNHKIQITIIDMKNSY